jgi:hypothetical protein
MPCPLLAILCPLLAILWPFRAMPNRPTRSLRRRGHWRRCAAHFLRRRGGLERASAHAGRRQAHSLRCVACSSGIPKSIVRCAPSSPSIVTSSQPSRRDFARYVACSEGRRSRSRTLGVSRRPTRGEAGGDTLPSSGPRRRRPRSVTSGRTRGRARGVSVEVGLVEVGLTDADEVARTTVFLGSRANGHITGEALRCDGFFVSAVRRALGGRAVTASGSATCLDIASPLRGLASTPRRCAVDHSLGCRAGCASPP